MDRLDVHLDRELDHLSRIADGAEFAEGLDGFFAKRRAAVLTVRSRQCTSISIVQALVERVDAGGACARGDRRAPARRCASASCRASRSTC